MSAGTSAHTGSRAPSFDLGALEQVQLMHFNAEAEDVGASSWTSSTTTAVLESGAFGEDGRMWSTFLILAEEHDQTGAVIQTVKKAVAGGAPGSAQERVRRHAVAQLWATKFSEACGGSDLVSDGAPVAFTTGDVMVLCDRPDTPAVAVERYVPDSRGTPGEAETALRGALAHFSLVSSGNTLVVTGTEDDAQISSVTHSFGTTDGGPDHIKLFESMHECGPVCQLLDLPPLPAPATPTPLPAHFVNPFPEMEALRGRGGGALDRAEEDARAGIRKRLPDLGAALLAAYPPYADQPPTSGEESRPDASVHSGAAGNALALWTLQEHHRLQGDNEQAVVWAEHARAAVDTALALVEEGGDGSSSAPVSFHLGSPGVFAVAAVILHEVEPLRARALVSTLFAFKSEALAHPEMELLCGQAGYLYALTYVRDRLPRSFLPANHAAVCREVFESIFRSVVVSPGTPDARLYLEALGPRTFLGAAHGIAGVLYALLGMPDLCMEDGHRTAVEGTLAALIAEQKECGGFPKMLEDRTKVLNYWCQGTSGIIPALCRGYSVFGDVRLLSSAASAGELLWREGLLRKGPSVCHGVSGSILATLALYQRAGERRLLYRALRMCEFTWNERFVAGVAAFPDPMRIVPGVADNPFSLMEGLAGVMCAYAAVLRPDVLSFPGF